MRLILLAALAMLAWLAPEAPALAAQDQLTCESINYQYRRCPVPNLKRADIINQIGNQPCQEGRTWGYDNGGVWVNNGCRGVFNIKYKDNGGGGGGYPPGYGDIVRCESYNYQPNRCPANTQGGVRLDRVLGGQCSEGRSWGWDRGGIWVNNGCRAQFIVGAGGGGGGGYPPGFGQEVRCESFNYQPNRCGANTQGGVRLSRVLGGDCREGRTWGWDRNSIWVNNGCRAIFLTGAGGGGGSGGSGGGWGNQTIQCESWNNRRNACNVTVRNGVRIERVLGGVCNRGYGWDWTPNFIWVDKGCRAVFQVY